ncbi:MAG TPA: tRNA epoxyqueuosine(34) reductase QueG [Bacteroidia bacterium]|nr:tRNA epoxyqueuosine(34) reductase QueG [Bacteroidia bacterium]MCE7955165.1 tRNA epoxyqueuosine(34) reductase QueG [Bacteroidetes bacterium CHB6]MCW5930066.1 tRNA epoxyqueuosine(34) reductase QueG [Bacteroidota bacterium]MCB8931799.1 tRNA epoxyqueuosine(34) reductase QueG [Bacteroidia bacterium]HNR49826.1 tRNA epoxyqueuosine(34) reductase QueG [Bacteroidia bacterium]
MNKSELTALIKEEAYRLGFAHCGISKADYLEEDAPHLEQWLKKGMHGTMGYMERNFDKRLDPRKLVHGAKSVISLLYNYYPAEKQNPGIPKISKYAYGRDYHFVIKEKLFLLFNFIREKAGNVSGRVFTDSAPVLDRAWAKKSGLGWIGKNANLIHPKAGSFFFIAELILDLELDTDAPVKDYCGSCTRCMDACPTDAIVQPHVVDGSKCISYFTIELRDNIPQSFKNKFENWMFGCDICQDVCPWNRFAKPIDTDELKPIKEIMTMTSGDWEEITEEVFKNIFKESPLSRAGFEGMKRNLQFIKPKKD